MMTCLDIYDMKILHDHDAHYDNWESGPFLCHTIAKIDPHVRISSLLYKQPNSNLQTFERKKSYGSIEHFVLLEFE